MADIAISRLGARAFRVQLREGGRETTHHVTAPETVGALKFPETDLERVVHESFEFLLEREPASSILSRFSLNEISRYFPEYEDELARRLA